MWALYESNQLTPDTVLRGQYRGSQKRANTDALLEFIGEVNEDERRRRTALGLNAGPVPPRPRRVEVIVNKGDGRGKRPAFVKGRAGTPPPGAVGGASRSVHHTRPAPQHSGNGGAAQNSRQDRTPPRPVPAPAHDRRGPDNLLVSRAQSAARNGSQTVDPSAPALGRRRRRRKPKQLNGAAQGGGAPQYAQRPAPEHSQRPAAGVQGNYSAPQPPRPQRPAPERPQRAVSNVEGGYPAATQHRRAARGPRARHS